MIEDSIVDGPGIRMTVFGQGCPHHCQGCQNPDTWAFDGGTEMQEEQIAEMIKGNPLVKGVTFSGGEPFEQAAGFAELARILKYDGYEVACYTGYTMEQLLNGTQEKKELLENLDVLIDGPFVLEQRSMSVIFRGSSNQRILDARKSLEQGKAIEVNSSRWTEGY